MSSACGFRNRSLRSQHTFCQPESAAHQRVDILVQHLSSKAALIYTDRLSSVIRVWRSLRAVCRKLCYPGHYPIRVRQRKLQGNLIYFYSGLGPLARYICSVTFINLFAMRRILHMKLIYLLMTPSPMLILIAMSWAHFRSSLLLLNKIDWSGIRVQIASKRLKTLISKSRAFLIRTRICWAGLYLPNRWNRCGSAAPKNRDVQFRTQRLRSVAAAVASCHSAPVG